MLTPPIESVGPSPVSMLLLTLALLAAMPLPRDFCRALCMPFRFSKPVCRRAASTHRRAPLKEHDWEENVLRNLTMSREVRDSEVL